MFVIVPATKWNTNKVYFERLTKEGDKFEKKPKISMQVIVKAERNNFARLY